MGDIIPGLGIEHLKFNILADHLGQIFQRDVAG